MQGQEATRVAVPRDGARDSCNWAWTSVLAGGTPAVGARALVPLLRLKVRCRLGEATFTRTDGNGRDAPLAAIGRGPTELQVQHP